MNNNNNNNDERRVVPTITLEEVMETFDGLDAVYVELAENAWNSTGRDDVTGVFVLNVNDDEGIDGEINIRCVGKVELIKAWVMIPKIRRESEGLEDPQGEIRQVPWCKMAHAYVTEFGANRTPSDIIMHLAEVQEAFNIYFD